jgi:predicted GIY-YIG superfamily endonuclease
MEAVVVSPALYILRCEDDTWYVGITFNLNIRFAQHWSGVGAKWTRLHKPVEVVEVIYPATNENEKTLELMNKYGWERVRGGSWTKIEMNRPKQIGSTDYNSGSDRG